MSRLQRTRPRRKRMAYGILLGVVLGVVFGITLENMAFLGVRTAVGTAPGLATGTRVHTGQP